MAWTVPQIHALLLRTPAPKPTQNLRVPGNKPMRSPSPRAMSAQSHTGYGK